MGNIHETLLAFQSSGATRGRPSRDSSEGLHSRILWSAWCALEGGPDQLERRYVIRRSSGVDELAIRTDEFEKYRIGSRSLSAARKALVVEKHPSLAPLVQWPLYLLSPRPLNARSVDAAVRLYLRPGPRWLPAFDWVYEFPNDPHELPRPSTQPIFHLDASSLFERGGVYGFIALAAAYRKHHLERSVDDQWWTARYLVKALPGFCRQSWVRPHAGEVISLTKELLLLLPDTSVRLQVNDAILWDQIKVLEHEPCRDVRLTAKKHGRFLEAPADPFASKAMHQRCLS